MKRSTRRLLKAALVCFVIGAAFGIASLCLGFRYADFRTAIEAGDFELVGSAGTRIGSFMSDVSASKISYNETFSGVKSLDLQTGVANCRIILYEGEEWKVTGTALPARFTCTRDGNELKIDCNNTWNFFGKGSSSAELEIYVPEAQTLKTVQIDAGVGKLEMEDGFLKCKELELDSGVGKCMIRADITKAVDIDGGVGEIQLVLKGEKTDYNYDIDSGIGSVQIGDSRYSGLGDDVNIDNGAERDILIDNGVGSVTIDFE